MSLPNRRSIRLPSFDYTENGAYYVTVCTHEQQKLFGHVENNEMLLNPAGRMLLTWLREIPHKFPGVTLDAHIVMPDHIHFVLFFEENPNSLGEILQWFKTLSTNAYIRGVKQGKYRPFRKKVWQRNYYEHVIRNREDLFEVRSYIEHNAAKYQFLRE